MTTHPVRVGISARPEHTTVERMRETWQQAEEIGVNDIYIWDHFFPLNGDPLRRALRVLDPARGYGRGHCPGLGSAPLVSAIGYRNPELIADMARNYRSPLRRPIHPRASAPAGRAGL